MVAAGGDAARGEAEKSGRVGGGRAQMRREVSEEGVW